MPHTPPGGDVAFDWTEVNCFLRPQAMLADEAAPGYGLLLLGLASLYRAWGAGGLFAAPGRGHFAFTREVFAPLAGIGVELSYVEDRGAVMDALRALLAGGPVIVPANIRALPYFQGFGSEDKSHFFLVRGHDPATDRFQLVDYLHVREDNLSLEYAPTTLPGELLGELTALYWDAFVGHAPTPDWDPRYWLLRVRPEASFRPLGGDALLRLFLAECRRVLDALEAAPHTARPLDDRALAELKAVHDAGDEERFSLLVHAYLQDANAALVHVKVAGHALRALGAGGEGELAALADDYRTRSSAVRSRLLVRSMVAPSLPAAEWEAFRGSLAALAVELRRGLRAAIPHRLPGE